MSIYLIAIIGYLVALLAACIWQAQREHTGDDFLVAGRTLPPHVLAFTLLSAWIGSGTVFGGAGLGYRVGLPALWQAAGAWCGIALMMVLAGRVRRIGQYTVPDILELRYGAAARVMGTLTIVLAYTTIAAYQFRGGGRLLNLVAGIDPEIGAIVVAAFCVAYTATAGMASIARLDVANGGMMLIGVGIAVVYLVGHGGGVARVTTSLRPDQLTLFGALSPREALALFLPMFCLLAGEASMYQKLFSARNERTARIAVVGWIAGTIVVQLLIVSLGLLGSVAIPGLGPVESDTVVVRVARDVLPTLVGLLLLAGAMAIVVSTANSMLLTSATNLVREVSRRSGHAQLDRRIVRSTRLAVVVLGAIGIVAGSFFPTVLAMALWAYTMYGAAITPALLAALVWPRATREAAVWSIAAGMSVTLLWELLGVQRGTAIAPAYVLGLQTIYPALFASVSTLVGVTLAATPQPAVLRES
jgi:SSS family solute:Na+ symporter/sodium/proline symporter